MANNGYYFVIPLVIYPFDIMISINEKDEVLIKRLIEYNNTKEECELLLDFTGTGRTVILPSNQTVIRLRISKKLHGIISHEVFHAVSFIMERIGMKLEIELSDEAYAYLIGYVTDKIYEKLK